MRATNGSASGSEQTRRDATSCQRFTTMPGGFHHPGTRQEPKVLYGPGPGGRDADRALLAAVLPDAGGPAGHRAAAARGHRPLRGQPGALSAEPALSVPGDHAAAAPAAG